MQEGACVLVYDIDDEPAKETGSAVEAEDGKATACVGDVTAPDFGDRFVSMALECFGGVDIIVNNAAAGSVYMLCIPESKYVSGQVIVGGGG